MLIGHAGHEEVEGTMGEAPDHIVLVETEEDVDTLEVEDPSEVAYISQTTLSVDETRAIIARLRERFPHITGPRTDDICYATTNRQAAVKQMAAQCDLVLVIGSKNSSNSNRLVDVARDYGADVAPDRQREPGRRGAGSRARASSASPPAPARPRSSSQRLVDFFRARGTQDVAEFEVMREDVRFMLPEDDPAGHDGGCRSLTCAPILRSVTRVRRLLPTLGVFLAVAAIVLAVNPLREALGYALHGDVHALQDQLQGLGVTGAIVLVSLILVHAVVLFPAEIVNATAGLVFGFGSRCRWSCPPGRCPACSPTGSATRSGGRWRSGSPASDASRPPSA